jgi:hypothetical protein
MERTLSPTLQVNSDPSQYGPGSVSVRSLGPDLLGLLSSGAQPSNLLKHVFRVAVAQALSSGHDSFPDVSGRYRLLEEEVHFIPHFPFERDVKYRAKFDLRLLDPFQTEEPLTLEFTIPSERIEISRPEVTRVYPSSDLLPENLLRFYVCFSNSMQRGQAVEEISLLDSGGQPVSDALYRPPVELWDRTVRRLTVLLDPGRLKRWVGPNVELGPPLKAGQRYTLEIGSGMTDVYGRQLRDHFRKHFIVGDPFREPISVESWKILPPPTNSLLPLVLMFSHPLDWALLFHSITVGAPDGSVVQGQAVVDQFEKRWRFIPRRPWVAGAYRVLVSSGLEDLCGNSVTGSFDRPLQRDPRLVTGMNGGSLAFQLT